MTKAQRVLDIELERLLLGELGEERMAEGTRALEEDSNIRERYLSLQASNDAILDQYPPRVMAAEIAAREGRQKEKFQRRSRFWLAVPTAAALSTAVVLAYLVTPKSVAPPGEEKPEVILLKGDSDPTLFVFRKSGDKEERLKEGALAAPGDLIQLRYAARGASHGIIFSVDGRGTVTLHFPSNEGGSTRMDERATHALGFSYELDDAPGFERFFFVTGDKPLKVQQILDKARKLGADARGKLSLEKGIYQTDFLLKKTTRTR